MKQNKRKSLTQHVGIVLLVIFLLGSCGDNLAPTVSPVTPGNAVTIPVIKQVTNTVSSVTTVNSSLTSTPVNNSLQPATTPAVQFIASPVVLVGELTYKPQASANSAGLADWPELKYANGVGLTAHTKTIRLKLDETQWQQLYTFDGKAGRIRRILVEGQRIAANVQGEEVLQINFMEPLGFEMLHRVGTLNYQTNSSTPELLFSPEGFKSSLTWHLVINTALVDQLGDLASLNGKRVLLDTEKINRQPDIFYVSGLEPLSKGPLLSVKADSLATYIADAPGPASVIGTNSSGYSLQDKTSGQHYYLILAEGIKFDANNTRYTTFNGEKLVSEKGQDLGGLLFVTSLTSGT